MTIKNAIHDRLLAGIATTSQDRLPALVRFFVQQRDLEMLQVILASGIVADDPILHLQLGAEIAPLAKVPAAAELVNEWLVLTGLETQEKLDNALHYADKSIVVAVVPGLLALGANPNATRDCEAGPTALGLAYSLGYTNVADIYIAHLKRQDQVPLYRYDSDGKARTLFDFFASSEFSGSISTVASVFQACAGELPETWCRDLGRAMLDNIGKREKPMFSPTDGRNETDMYLISRCHFDDPADWIRLLAAGPNRATIPTQMAHNSKYSRFAPELVPRMMRAGVDLDAIGGKFQKGKTSCPLLFCAVGAANVTLLKLLLDGGADPARKIDIYDPSSKQMVQRDAFELAPPGSDTDSVLRIWRTHQMVQEIGRTRKIPGRH